MKAISAVQQDYDAIHCALEEIKKSACQNEVRAKASGILNQMKEFHSIFCLKMMVPIIQLILKVSESCFAPNGAKLRTFEAENDKNRANYFIT